MTDDTKSRAAALRAAFAEAFAPCCRTHVWSSPAGETIVTCNTLNGWYCHVRVDPAEFVVTKAAVVFDRGNRLVDGRVCQVEEADLRAYSPGARMGPVKLAPAGGGVEREVLLEGGAFADPLALVYAFQAQAERATGAR